MKNYNEKELDIIFENALKGGEIHEFSESYKKRRKEIMKSVSGRNIRIKRICFTTAAAAAVIAIIPLGVYAYSLITANIEKTEKYRSTVYVSAGEEMESDPMEVVLSYVPESLVLQGEDSPFAGKYKNENGGGMTSLFYHLSGETYKNLSFSQASEEFETETAKILINYRVSFDAEKASPDNFGREVFVVMKNAPYLARLYFTDDILSEEIRKIAEGVTLKPAETELYPDFAAEPEAEEGETDDEAVNAEKIYAVGEKAQFKYSDGVTLNVAVRSVNFYDSYETLTTDDAGYDKDFSAFVGSLDENIRTYYTYGDGISTLDEDIEERNVPLEIVTMEVEYENISSEEAEICVCPTLFTGIGDDTRLSMQSGENGIGIRDTLAAKCDSGLQISFVASGEHNKNNIIVPAGEKQTVKISFIFEKEYRDSLYLSYTYSSDPTSFIKIDE
ncbi:MAG: hypothetical protein LUI05_06345 [Oscillospiraceae bacterium]|nr:hypothetical protein [Oscillospiraceae bacterium]